jgi:hypothetical protein
MERDTILEAGTGDSPNPGSDDDDDKENSVLPFDATNSMHIFYILS